MIIFFVAISPRDRGFDAHTKLEFYSRPTLLLKPQAYTGLE